MIRTILKAVFIGWLTKKLADRYSRRNEAPQPAGPRPPRPTD